MIDSHCHLTHSRFDSDRDAVIAGASEAGVTCCVTIGTGVEDARACLELSRRHPGRIAATAGLDPFTSHTLGDGFDEGLAALAELLAAPGFCALGEVGLDYHYDLAPREVQIDQFHRQLELAERCDLPVVIHVREAHPDMIAVLREHPANRGVIHSFTAGPEEAEAYLEIGWWLAYNGVATFKNAEAVREAARQTPADRILVETDAPYLAPVPRRGRRCEPALVVHTVERLARERGVGTAELARVTAENARALFRLESV